VASCSDLRLVVRLEGEPHPVHGREAGERVSFNCLHVTGGCCTSKQVHVSNIKSMCA
jgi:hypothetical protein